MMETILRGLDAWALLPLYHKQKVYVYLEHRKRVSEKNIWKKTSSSIWARLLSPHNLHELLHFRFRLG